MSLIEDQEIDIEIETCDSGIDLSKKNHRDSYAQVAWAFDTQRRQDTIILNEQCQKLAFPPLLRCGQFGYKVDREAKQFHMNISIRGCWLTATLSHLVEIISSLYNML